MLLEQPRTTVHLEQVEEAKSSVLFVYWGYQVTL